VLSRMKNTSVVLPAAHDPRLNAAAIMPADRWRQ